MLPQMQSRICRRRSRVLEKTIKVIKCMKVEIKIASPVTSDQRSMSIS